jgi:hypothetical protein
VLDGSLKSVEAELLGVDTLFEPACDWPERVGELGNVRGVGDLACVQKDFACDPETTTGTQVLEPAAWS